MKTISPILAGLCLVTLVACGGTETSSDSTTSTAEDTSTTTTETDTVSEDTSGDATSDEPETDTEDSASDSGEQASEDSATTEELAPQLEGTYAYKRTITTSQEVPMMGRSETVSTSWGYTSITSYDDQIWFTEYGCHVETSGSSMIEVEIPDIIAQTIEPEAVAMRVWKDGETIHWERPETVTLLGVRLDDPLRDELPDTPTDSRVFDQDGDGQPGITVKIDGFISGDLYVVQRTTNTYIGTLNGESLLGSIEEYGEQKVLGSTNSMLEQDVPSEAINDPEVNRIHMVPVDSSVTCAWIIENADMLF